MVNRPESRPKMNDEKQTVAQWVQDNFLVLILAGAGALLFYENQRARTNDPTPKPPEVFNAEKAATKAIKLYRAGLSDSFAKVAAEINAGKIESNVSYFDFIAPLNESNRRAAFAEIDKEMNEQFGEDRWDANRAAKLSDELSKGFK